MPEPPNHSITPQWSPPKSFEEFRLLWPLSRGGMGEVYLGHDTLLDRPVAVKFISTPVNSPALREQFMNEARAAARLQHPNVVTIYRVGEVDDHPVIISEFVRGQNLDALPKPVPWSRAVEIGLGLGARTGRGTPSRSPSSRHQAGQCHHLERWRSEAARLRTGRVLRCRRTGCRSRRLDVESGRRDGFGVWPVRHREHEGRGRSTPDGCRSAVFSRGRVYSGLQRVCGRRQSQGRRSFFFDPRAESPWQRQSRPEPINRGERSQPEGLGSALPNDPAER
jgi:hypothetical protein